MAFTYTCLHTRFYTSPLSLPTPSDSEEGTISKERKKEDI